MDTLIPLNQIQPEQLALVGHKAFHLGELLQKGYPVVPGVVVSAEVFRSFLATVDWVNPLFADLPSSQLRLDIDNAQQLQAIAQKLRSSIESATVSASLIAGLERAVQGWQGATLIVRPSIALELPKTSRVGKSLPQAFRSAGLMTVQVCSADVGFLVEAIKRLWAELFRAKSLFYWQRLGIPLQRVHFAVLVQPIYPAIAAGTVRTKGRQVEIRAAPGLGMAISWGEIIPDVYQIDASTGTVLAEQLGWKSFAYGLSGDEALFQDRHSPSPIVDTMETTVPRIALGKPLSLPGTPADSPSKAAAISLATYLLGEEYQQRSTLSADDLCQVRQLIQTVARTEGTALELEWVLWNQQGQPTLAITQVIPQAIASSSANLAPVVASPMVADRSIAGRSLLQPEFVQPAGPSPTPSIEPTLIVAGLGASGGQAIAEAVVITDLDRFPESLPRGAVLVVPTISLDWLPILQQAAGLVVEQGSLTSHSAIVARELGIPAVLGAVGATQRIESGERIWVDGDQGKVYHVSNLADFLLPIALPTGMPTAPSPAESVRSPLARPVIGTRLMVNISQPDGLARIAGLPIDGIGLLRAELLAIAALDGQHPLIWLQQNREAELIERMATAITEFAEAIAPHPVFYRSFDFRLHEFSELYSKGLSAETIHTLLGLRGTLSYMKYPALFQLELRAIAQVQQAGHHNVRLLLPFVRTVEEFTFCRRLVEQAGLTRIPDFQLWIMAEVPSVLLLVPDYVQAGVQGISIGTNDLTQLLLGISRDQAELADLFEERHPAVKRAIAQLIHQAYVAGIPCAICGEAPVRFPELIDELVRWGIHSISVAPDAVDSTYAAIARAERTLILEAARQVQGEGLP